MTVTSKVRLYDLAKELKQDTKRLIEEVRREGVDVSVPSNSVSKELADKIRNRYFPKKEATAKRKVVVVKRSRPVAEEATPVERTGALRPRSAAQRRRHQLLHDVRRVGVAARISPRHRAAAPRQA